MGKRYLVLIKPDVSGSADKVEIIKTLLGGKKFFVRMEKKIALTGEIVDRLYPEVLNKEFYKKHKEFMLSSDVIALNVEYVGISNDPVKQLLHFKEMVRSLFASRRKKRRNAVHTSDSKENGKRELSIFWPGEMLVE